MFCVGDDGLVFLNEGASDAARRRLPRSARLVDPRAPSAGLYEFEVVTGNAAYRQGEHFYLTRAQAEEAYRRLPRIH